MKYQRGLIPPGALKSADLSHGDQAAAGFSWTGLSCHRVEDADDPAFDAGYRFLHAEFDPRGEIETADVLKRRFDWDPAKTVDGLAMLYEMIVVQGAQGLAAVRDHTAILNLNQPEAPLVVHLSHVLVAPEWRGSGLAAWMRALPLETARACIDASGIPADHPIVLASEMDHLDATDPASRKRLAAYERAGFVKADPARVVYCQPDFRPPEQIDAAGGPRLLPMNLVLRRVGRENQSFISGQELRWIVEAIYGMFGATFRTQDMAGVWEQMNEYPRPDEMVRLMPPTG